MTFTDWSNAQGMYRGIRSYAAKTAVTAGDYYHETIPDTTINNYNDFFIGRFCNYIPTHTGSYAIFLMAEQEGVAGARVLGVGVACAYTEFHFQIVEGTTTDTLGNYTITNTYTDSRSWPANNYYVLTVNYDTRNADSSFFWVNGVKKAIEGVPIDNNPIIFQSYRIFDSGTPAGYELAGIVMSFDTNVTSDSALSKVFVGSTNIPIFLGKSRFFSTGEYKTITVDNGTSDIINLSTGNTFLQKRDGAIPPPVEHKSIEFNVDTLEQSGPYAVQWDTDSLGMRWVAAAVGDYAPDDSLHYFLETTAADNEEGTPRVTKMYSFNIFSKKLTYMHTLPASTTGRPDNISTRAECFRVNRNYGYYTHQEETFVYARKLSYGTEMHKTAVLFPAAGSCMVQLVWNARTYVIFAMSSGGADSTFDYVDVQYDPETAVFSETKVNLPFIFNGHPTAAKFAGPPVLDTRSSSATPLDRIVPAVCETHVTEDPATFTYNFVTIRWDKSSWPIDQATVVGPAMDTAEQASTTLCVSGDTMFRRDGKRAPNDMIYCDLVDPAPSWGTCGEKTLGSLERYYDATLAQYLYATITDKNQDVWLTKQDPGVGAFGSPIFNCASVVPGFEISHQIGSIEHTRRGFFVTGKITNTTKVAPVIWYYVAD